MKINFDLFFLKSDNRQTWTHYSGHWQKQPNLFHITSASAIEIWCQHIKLIFEFDIDIFIYFLIFDIKLIFEFDNWFPFIPFCVF